MKDYWSNEIFFGDDSRPLWDAINKLRNLKDPAYDVWHAVYFLACRCQELEGIVRKMQMWSAKGQAND